MEERGLKRLGRELLEGFRTGDKSDICFCCFVLGKHICCMVYFKYNFQNILLKPNSQNSVPLHLHIPNYELLTTLPHLSHHCTPSPPPFSPPDLLPYL